MYNGKTPVLIVVGGATASGKTALAIEYAKYFNTEIISFDSRQVYKELNIGVAKPTDEQLNLVKHHFINHCSVFDEFNAGIFETKALAILNKLYKKHKVVIAVGGTGLYIKTLCNGLDKLPLADYELRKKLKNELELYGVEHIYQILQKADPLGYKQIDSKNPHRIIRAIELVKNTGKSLSEIKTSVKNKRNFKILNVTIDIAREKLYENINQRTEIMIAQGLEQECRNLYHLKNLKALQTVGYTEIFEYFDGKYNLSQAIEKIKQHTRNYAKRQITWFKNQQDNISHIDFDVEKLKNHITAD
ncbi:MAG: tRNA (adenosine(37)-N6)-dimethylallyltransferase MiaA [Bacteroidetes bacterium]|nr:tRNA (adenosine(37)-N6)-dimethylallyltransferase MiaA [Bacteroidota bacterium]